MKLPIFFKKKSFFYINTLFPNLKSKKNIKIIINLKNDKVTEVKQAKIPEKCHYFIVEDNEFNLWLNNKITFEEVLGTRRFRYNRNPNIYRVEINQIYTNFL